MDRHMEGFKRAVLLNVSAVNVDDQKSRIGTCISGDSCLLHVWVSPVQACWASNRLDRLAGCALHCPRSLLHVGEHWNDRLVCNNACIKHPLSSRAFFGIGQIKLGRVSPPESYRSASARRRVDGKTLKSTAAFPIPT
jgi:hypothetical protein